VAELVFQPKVFDAPGEAVMLSCLPNAEEVIEAAKAEGWQHSRMMLGGIMRDVLNKSGHPSIILQTISEDSWYSHTVARGYARRIGILIEAFPEQARSSKNS
jgi:hypothetical protein